MLIDTHCHIHSDDFPLDSDETMAAAHAAGVDKFLCVGTSLDDSIAAVNFANAHNEAFAIIGIHPHGESNDDDSSHLVKDDSSYSWLRDLLRQNQKIVGIGEIGLDYHYTPFDRNAQIELFERQLQIARDFNLPVSFHVREAFHDFWPIIDNFHGIKGVLHSFTDNVANMEKGLSRGFYVGVNGIATFNREPNLLAAHKSLPPNRMLLETDAPFLSPVPFRGKPNQPSFIPKIVVFLADLRGESYDNIAAQTTGNAEKLFVI